MDKNKITKPIILDETAKRQAVALETLAEKVGFLKGDKGDKGDTPIKGQDYYTEVDKAEIKDDVKTAVLGEIHIPTDNNELTNGAGYITSSSLPTKVSDLTNDSNFITTNSVGKAILTIQKNGSQIAQFGANATSNVTANITVPTKVSDLTNDANYQTATDVASMIASIPQFSISIVDSLPSSGQKMVLYLVPKTSAGGDDIYDEYIWIESNSSFELVGSTTIDLGDYYTKTDTDGLLELKQDIITDLDTIRNGASKGATALQSVPSEYVTETELNAKGYLTSYTETDPIYTADKPNLALKSEIPTKTSQLTNDSGFITSSYHDSTKQDKLTAGDNITIVNNVISATGGGGGGGVDVVQTTGNSTTAVMSQKATTDMPAFKEVVAPTKMLKAFNTQYCTSYDTFDYEDIKVAQVYCRQAYSSYGISHTRRGDIRYQSAISLYKDSNNYLNIYFNNNRLAVRNRKDNVTINEVDLGAIDSGDTSINRPENTAWCAEINLQEKTCIFYVMRNGQLSPFGEVVDISTWDLSHLDTFNIVFGCSEYFGDSFCYYCLLNEKIEIENIINTPIEYGKYNCYDTYLKNDIKPLQVTGIYADSTSGGSVAGTLIEEYDNFHKVFSFSIPENSSTPYYLGLYGQVQGNKHKGQNFVIKCKFLEFAEGAWLKFGQNAVDIYKGTEFVLELLSISHSFVPELNVEYTFVINQANGNPSAQYLLRGVGNFTMETLDMYYMVPQSANICAETWDGNFFRGVLPFVGTNVQFSNDYSPITTSRTGLGVPKYFQTTASNGNIYMYNGTTWKQISN